MENPTTKAPPKKKPLIIERPTIDPRARAQAARALLKKNPPSAKKTRGAAVQREISVGKKPVNSNGKCLEQPPVLGEGNGPAASPSPFEPQRKRAKVDQPPKAGSEEEFKADVRRVRAEAEARGEALGAVSLMEDFAAVKRLCESGEAFFREAYADYPVKLARALRGKIHATNTETAFFNHQLRKVQKQFKSLNTSRYSEWSSESRTLKEQADRLSGVQSELDKVNAALAEKNKLLESLPSMQTKVERATSSEKALKSKNDKLQASVENMKAELAVAEGRVESAKAKGFTQAYRVSYVVTPFIDSAYYDMLHTAEDDKIWKDGHVVISEDEYRERIAKEAMLAVDESGEEDQPEE